MTLVGGQVAFHEFRILDPLTVAKVRLQALGVSESEIADVEHATRARIEQAVEAALAAPYPDPGAERAREYAP